LKLKQKAPNHEKIIYSKKIYIIYLKLLKHEKIEISTQKKAEP